MPCYLPKGRLPHESPHPALLLPSPHSNPLVWPYGGTPGRWGRFSCDDGVCPTQASPLSALLQRLTHSPSLTDCWFLDKEKRLGFGSRLVNFRALE